MQSKSSFFHAILILLDLGEGKVSRIDTKPAPEGLNTLITTEIHLHAEIAKLKSELSKLTEISIIITPQNSSSH
jgi:hypothetical protein